MTLRERCESLCLDLGGPTSMCPSAHRPYVDKLESFARNIRTEVLDQVLAVAEERDLLRAALEVAKQSIKGATDYMYSCGFADLDGYEQMYRDLKTTLVAIDDAKEKE